MRTLAGTSTGGGQVAGPAWHQHPGQCGNRKSHSPGPALTALRPVSAQTGPGDAYETASLR